MTTGKTIGAVFPINSSQASRFFDEGRRVFVKFTNMSNFKTNSKIVLYVTKEKVLVGEGTVKIVQRMLTSEAWRKYNQDVFLNQDEYNKYASWSTIGQKTRSNAEVTVFVLKNLRRYRKSQPFKGMTPSGRYLSEEEYSKINS
jgi:hypothetical protein